ncbi:beta-1,3-galactosyl-O-glycosyl-glycoprotein beta-1,6-N-acetylglucosaminyltransferase 3-like [Acipenser oxyrinchus oxyrinchus]|uniref:Beta-1,3-galactosyl-O-glycosyl-glycoprotein beta-1,6-N-acetylglucosaminyltransferase 3 n=1 Tax=Acipenser oxyrinchus oxyrinchus TaxID=40147 RepID=A0AAD8CUS6_ACIOX|nr:beta-1,3-galactosyl-O-glycosyl-glycoprotein beta-1,6-N-acetylglucosaminyltransferase 3-like [Acipenser oxyrinchus oxyrinchus]
MVLQLQFWRQPCKPTDIAERSVHLLSGKNQDFLSNCSRIIKGDVEAIEQTLLSQLLTANKKKPLTENDYLDMTVDCSAFSKNRRFLTFPLSQEERDFPIAYSLVVHEKIEMFERLLRAIYNPQNVYCVHVDQKSPENFTKAVRAIVSCLPNVFVASKLEKVVYASWSRVQADLNCMKDLLATAVQWRYLLNTCGTDFPIKTNAEIVRSLKVLNGKNSLESETTPEHKKTRWMYHYEVTDSISKTDTKKSPPPIISPMFSGNAYFVVSREFVEYLFENPEAQKLIEWEKDTYSPDEHLWATLQRMPGVPGSNPPNEKFHASDMSSIARLVKWSYLEGDVSKGAPYPRCTGTHRRSVCVYGSGDLQWLLRQHHLFANKFDREVDDIAIQCLEEHLRHKAIYGAGF